jgi:hypothetical protein
VALRMAVRDLTDGVLTKETLRGELKALLKELDQSEREAPGS